jgi:hypothetical protein
VSQKEGFQSKLTSNAVSAIVTRLFQDNQIYVLPDLFQPLFFFFFFFFASHADCFHLHLQVKEGTPISLPLSTNWQVQITQSGQPEHQKELRTSGHCQLMFQMPTLHNWECVQTCRTHRSLKSGTSISHPKTTPSSLTYKTRTQIARPTPKLQTPDHPISAGPIPNPGLLKLAVCQEALTQAVCSHPILVVPRILT